MKEFDPNADNVLTGVNFGRGLPRALAKEGVPVASVGNLDTYGLLTGYRWTGSAHAGVGRLLPDV